MIKTEFLNLEKPEIWLEEKEFTLTFTNKEVEIEVDFNDNYCGWKGRMIININELETIINKLKTI